MRFTKKKELTLSQKQEIFELWNREYPRKLKYKNIEELENYLNKLEDQNHILLLDDDNKIIGWYFDFIRENERWFAVILASEFQRRKLGTQMIELAKQERSELNGWVIKSDNYKKINGQPYKSPTHFYKKSGFKVFEDVELKTDEIIAIKIKWFKIDYKRYKNNTHLEVNRKSE